MNYAMNGTRICCLENFSMWPSKANDLTFIWNRIATTFVLIIPETTIRNPQCSETNQCVFR